jgi:hypothetical protein
MVGKMKISQTQQALRWFLIDWHLPKVAMERPKSTGTLRA